MAGLFKIEAEVQKCYTKFAKSETKEKEDPISPGSSYRAANLTRPCNKNTGHWEEKVDVPPFSSQTKAPALFQKPATSSGCTNSTPSTSTTASRESRRNKSGNDKEDVPAIRWPPPVLLYNKSQ